VTPDRRTLWVAALLFLGSSVPLMAPIETGQTVSRWSGDIAGVFEQLVVGEDFGLFRSWLNIGGPDSPDVQWVTFDNDTR